MRLDVVVLAALPPAAAGAVAQAGVASDEHVKFATLLVGTVVTVAGLIAWIDSRIAKATNAQTKIFQAELRHLREILAVKLEAPELVTTGEWPLHAVKKDAG